MRRLVARDNNMVRAFAIAPTASCSYRSTDLRWVYLYPEIAPPIARTVDRDSGTFGVQTYDYGEVEIASEVGWENYKRVADGIMLYSITRQDFFTVIRTTGGQIWLSWMNRLLKSGSNRPRLRSTTPSKLWGMYKTNLMRMLHLMKQRLMIILHLLWGTMNLNVIVKNDYLCTYTRTKNF